MSINDILELNLRDYVLDLEDKIKVGCLGSLKVGSREAWRNAINNRKYDRQSDKLVYGSNETPVELIFNSKIKTEVKSSRPGTPDSDIGSSSTKKYVDPGKYLGPPEKGEFIPNSAQQTSIKEMACAVLQIFHAIEPKYLKKPFGDDKDKKGLNERACEEARDRWEQSLMASTSWSQLFVHLNTLDNSIAWSRSASNAQCRICRKRRDAENMLLCDGCNKGHHLYCLKPKLNVSMPKLTCHTTDSNLNCAVILFHSCFRLYQKVIGSVLYVNQERNQKKKQRREGNLKMKKKKSRYSLKKQGIIELKEWPKVMKMNMLNTMNRVKHIKFVQYVNMMASC